jgi:hypothetical protein
MEWHAILQILTLVTPSHHPHPLHAPKQAVLVLASHRSCPGLHWRCGSEALSLAEVCGRVMANALNVPCSCCFTHLGELLF